MHPSQNTTALAARVGGVGADMPDLPGQLVLSELSDLQLVALLHRFRTWLASEWAGGATHIPISAVHAYFGWPRP